MDDEDRKRSAVSRGPAARRHAGGDPGGSAPVFDAAGAGTDLGAEATSDAEPALAHRNQGRPPGLDDQGEGPTGPSLDAAADVADVRPLTVEGGAKGRPAEGDPADPSGQKL